MPRDIVAAFRTGVEESPDFDEAHARAAVLAFAALFLDADLDRLVEALGYKRDDVALVLQRYWQNGVLTRGEEGRLGLRADWMDWIEMREPPRHPGAGRPTNEWKAWKKRDTELYFCLILDSMVGCGEIERSEEDGQLVYGKLGTFKREEAAPLAFLPARREAPPVPPPPPAAEVEVAAAMRPIERDGPKTAEESIAEFIARGGHITKLPPAAR